MHLRDDEIGRLIRPSLADEGALRAREHAAACAQCGERLRQALDADRRVGALLALIDHPVPKIEVGAVLARRRRSRSAPLRKIAAGMVIFVATATVALALPGSPLQRLMKNIASRFSESPVSSGTIRKPAAPQPGEAAAGSNASSNSGVAIVPDTVLEIAFRYRQPAGEIHIGFTGGHTVSLASSDPSVAFDVQPARIVVNNAKPGADYQISLPPALARVTVTIDKQIVFAVDHGVDVTSPPAKSPGGAVTIPFKTARAGR